MSHDDVFAIKCPVCDTHVQVSPDQIDATIECPDCTSQVLVKRPVTTRKTNPRWKQYEPERSQIRQDEELNLGDPIERPKIDFDVDPSFGLEPVTADLLAPKPVADDVDGSPAENDSGQASPQSPNPANPFSQAIPEKSQRERLQTGRRKQLDLKNSSFKPDEGGGSESKSGQPNIHQAPGFPEFDQRALLAAVKDMLLSPGLIWRAVVAWLLMGVGWAIMLEFSNSFTNSAKSGAPGLGDWVLHVFSSFLLGGLPLIAGTLLLWFICGYVFRDSASGHRQVTKWGVSGSSELFSTILVFAFSFLISGLPLLFVPFLVAPFRFFAAPPLLLSAWFNHNPFAIVSVDAFQTVKQDANQWKSFYTFVLQLAVLSLIAGLLLMIRVFLLLWIFSLAGMALLVPITIAFAAVTGWHCGRIIQSLEKHV